MMNPQMHHDLFITDVEYDADETELAFVETRRPVVPTDLPQFWISGTSSTIRMHQQTPQDEVLARCAVVAASFCEIVKLLLEPACISIELLRAGCRPAVVDLIRKGAAETDRADHGHEAARNAAPNICHLVDHVY